MTTRLLSALAVLAIAACAQTLPEHDNRIFTAAPIAKLSAADLVRAFEQDTASATSRYVGRAIEVSGTVRDLAATMTPLVFGLAAGESERHIRVSMHADRSADLAKSLANGQRVTLRCFVEGVTEHVILKSCVVP